MMVLEKSAIINVGRNVILCIPCLLVVRAAVTEYHRLGSLNYRNLLSQFWRFEIHIQDQNKVDSF